MVTRKIINQGRGRNIRRVIQEINQDTRGCVDDFRLDTMKKEAGIETAIGCHTFRATGITIYLLNGGRLRVEETSGRSGTTPAAGRYWHLD